MIACLDGSRYFSSVCEHAAWLAARLGCDLDLLHARDADAEPADPRAPAPVLQEARERLSDLGVEVQGLRAPMGPFLAAAVEAGQPGAFLVVGRRGRGSQPRTQRVGGSVEALIETCAAPLLVAGQVFLEIRKVLVWPSLGPEPVREAYSTFLARTRVLDGLEVHMAPESGASDVEPPEGASGAWPAARRLVASLRPGRDKDAVDMVVAPRDAFTSDVWGGRRRALAHKVLASKRALLIL